MLSSIMGRSTDYATNLPILYRLLRHRFAQHQIAGEAGAEDADEGQRDGHAVLGACTPIACSPYRTRQKAEHEIARAPADGDRRRKPDRADADGPCQQHEDLERRRRRQERRNQDGHHPVALQRRQRLLDARSGEPFANQRFPALAADRVHHQAAGDRPERRRSRRTAASRSRWRVTITISRMSVISGSGRNDESRNATRKQARRPHASASAAYPGDEIYPYNEHVIIPVAHAASCRRAVGAGGGRSRQRSSRCTIIDSASRSRHYDARGHLIVARRIFDSITPGWQQIGAVWLPLPHLLNALPVQNDFLYRTGASGVAISIASFAVATGAIAWIVATVTGSALRRRSPRAVFALNPNVLFLQSTPMTEPLSARACCIAAVAALLSCLTRLEPPARLEQMTRPPITRRRRRSSRWRA